VFEGQGTSYNVKPILQEKYNDVIIKHKFDFYLYCNVIRESYLNSAKQNILKFVHCDHAGNLTETFDTLIYLPVDLLEIHQIKFTLLTSDFKPMLFKNGTTIPILQFKDKND
jgi:hypothetical protein